MSESYWAVEYRSSKLNAMRNVAMRGTPSFLPVFSKQRPFLPKRGQRYIVFEDSAIFLFISLNRTLCSQPY